MRHPEFQRATPVGRTDGRTRALYRLGAAATLACCVLVGHGPSPAVAQGNSYHITEAEKAACTPDAQRLCSSAYPDESKLLTCMTANQRSLSAGCAVVFKAGKKERGLR